MKVSMSTRWPVVVASFAMSTAVLGVGWWIGKSSADKDGPVVQLPGDLAQLLTAGDQVGLRNRDAPTLATAVVDAPPAIPPESKPAEDVVIREPAAVPATQVASENDPTMLFDLASGLLNRDDFVNQLVDSQVQIEVPAIVNVNAAVADRAYWSLVHSFAAQMYMYRPEVMARDPALAASASSNRIRVDILQSLMPDLPGLIRDKKVAISLQAKGGSDPPHGDIRSSNVSMYVDEKCSSMFLTMRRGTLSIRLTIPKSVVVPDLWAQWSNEQRKHMYSASDKEKSK